MNVLPFNSGHEPPEDALFSAIANDLERKGYFILPDALPVELAACLHEGIWALEADKFHRAGIGRGQDHLLNRFVRRDKIHWIDESEVITRPWLDWTEKLRLHLNRHLFLGLFSFESHYSWYQPGDFYKRHVDAFRGESNRVLSLVTYLNPGWEPGQGGELVLYPEQKEAITIVPAMGTLVIFLSEEFPHEVLPTKRERLAVAGWYHLNTSSLTEIDPPT